jgi:hypothetical protein
MTPADPDGVVARWRIDAWTVADLLAAHAKILDELRTRRIIRTSNSPLSDYAELLFCRAFGWEREQNAAKGHDATDAQGTRFQIKARRLTRHNASRQLSAIRGLEGSPFDHLAGVLVDESFGIVRAALIPRAIVHANATEVPYTNSWRFLLRDHIWSIPGVCDVTPELRNAASNL